MGRNRKDANGTPQEIVFLADAIHGWRTTRPEQIDRTSFTTILDRIAAAKVINNKMLKTRFNVEVIRVNGIRTVDAPSAVKQKVVKLAADIVVGRYPHLKERVLAL